MGRPLRVEVRGVWYHLTGRGNERKAIYRDDGDHKAFLGLVGQLEERYGVRVGAYVLMGNHYHLLIELLEPNLSRAVQWLQVNYAIYFNRKYRRNGHLFQARYGAVAIEDGNGVAEVSRYIHLNPIRIASLGLDKKQQHRLRQGEGTRPDSKQLAEWLSCLAAYRWSSYPAYGSDGAPAWLAAEEVIKRLGLEGTTRDWARYVSYVEEGVRLGGEESFHDRIQAGTFYGGEAFVVRMMNLSKGNKVEQKAIRHLQVRPKWEEAVAAVEKTVEGKWQEFQNLRGHPGREMAIKLAREKCGLSLGTIGEKVGLGYNAVAMTLSRFTRRLQEEKELEKMYQWAVKFLNV